MKNTVVYIALCLALPVALLCFYLEKRARRIMLSMLLGVAAGIAAHAVNNGMRLLLPVNDRQYPVFIAPIAEELLKFISVFVFAGIVKKGKRGSTANAFAVGVGFCITENFLYLFTYLDTASIFWIISRSIGTGLMHCITSAVYGVTLFTVRQRSRGKARPVPVILLCGMLFHGIFNCLVQTEHLKALGILMPITAFVVLFYFIKGTELHDFLWDKSPAANENRTA